MTEEGSTSLESLFESASRGRPLASCWGARRCGISLAGLDLVLDSMQEPQAECLALRAERAGPIRLSLNRVTSIEEIASGGWLVGVESGSDFRYWIPAAPKLHRLERLGRILEDRVARPTGTFAGSESVALTFQIPEDTVLDCAIWRLTARVANDLKTLESVECQGYFLWGSHTVFSRPADLYRHVVHGLVYEDRYEWPKRWRVCSENDAHALFVVCTGLASATGKQIYALLKTQILLAVLARQSTDGGYRHGTWTAELESHFRLHASAMHLFMDAIDQCADEALRSALVRAAGFTARQVDRTDFGTWFLHDELELSAKAMDRGPFRWIPATALGKSSSNMLVLNTHLDLLVAMCRFARQTGTRDYDELIESARRAALAVVDLNPMQGFYSAIFRLIELTMMPTPMAERLPLPLRALKRFARDFVVPRLPGLKTRFPRLVMPNGYVDRALSIRNWSHRYLGINAMDLARASACFPADSAFLATARNALEFALRSGIAERWREASADRYAIGFLAEALARLCALDDALVWRTRLVQQLFAMSDLGLGYPPTLLGSNGEATAASNSVACPSPLPGALRTAVLQGPTGPEILVINTATEGVVPAWSRPPPAGFSWLDPAGNPADPARLLPGRSWFLARYAG